MSSLQPEPDRDLDALAATLRADAADMRAFLPAIAVRLEEAFPDRCQVKRKRKGMLSGERVVDSVSVAFGDEVYRLGYEGKQVTASRVKVVRGITLKSEPLAVETWIGDLVAELNSVAADTEAGRIALQNLLEGTR
jgi:hypothetical protein